MSFTSSVDGNAMNQKKSLPGRDQAKRAAPLVQMHPVHRHARGGVPSGNSDDAPGRKPPAPPHIYRPQPVPKVLQNKNASFLSALVPPRAIKSPTTSGVAQLVRRAARRRAAGGGAGGGGAAGGGAGGGRAAGGGAAGVGAGGGRAARRRRNQARAAAVDPDYIEKPTAAGKSPFKIKINGGHELGRSRGLDAHAAGPNKPLAKVKGKYGDQDAEVHVHFDDHQPIDSHTGAHVKCFDGSYPVNWAAGNATAQTLDDILQVAFGDLRWKQRNNYR